jgi:hypothetical protein
MKNFETIDRYLRGKMAAAEQEDFEQALANDTELKHEYLLQRSEEEALERLAIKKRIQTLQQQQAASQQKPAVKKLMPRNFLPGILLSVLLVAIVIWVLNTLSEKPVFNKNSNSTKTDTLKTTIKPSSSDSLRKDTIQEQRNQTSPSPPIAMVEKYYNTTFNTDPEISLKSGGTEPGDSPLEAAYQALTDKKYTKVIQLAQPFTQDSIWNTSALELVGHARFQQKNFSQATAAFAQLDQKKDPFYGQKWQWYLLLSYAAQLPTTKTAFESTARQIEADTEHPFYLKMRELRAELRKSGY